MSKILAIDDNPDNLITVSALLRHLIPECTVLTAQSGMEGIRKAKAEWPDTILLDVRMPGMDGFEVCKRLKSDPDTLSIPVIMLTAVDTDSENRIRGLDIGADAFLAKPIDPAELAAQVRVVLRIKEAEDCLRRERNSLDQLVHERTRELRKAEEHYRTLFNSTNDAIFIHDLKGCLLDVNDEACRRLGYRREELLKMATRDLDTSDYASLASSMSEKIKHCGQALFETAHITREGRVIPTELSSRLIDYDGEPAFLSIARDITERKRAEGEKRKLEDQLRQAQKMEAIGTLAGGIAHDFNNILSVIIGYTEMMELFDGSDDRRIRSNLREILKASYRAKDLVLQILSFSRHTEQEKRPVLLTPIIKEALKFLRASLPATIEIRQNLQETTASVLADPTQMHQVIMNLCTNAAHAMKEKGGVLEVGLDQVHFDVQMIQHLFHLEPGPYLRLSVKDTGHGMNRETMERIFDPYFTTKERGEGTGLGLAIAHGIVTNHGGAITVSSERGKGTTFQVFLPELESLSFRSIMDSSLSPPGGNERILFVDDEQGLIEIGKGILEHLGYEVVAEMGSLAALELFRSEGDRFDLVITDLTMSHMTGTELARKLLSIRPDIPIILCTGFTDGITQEDLRSSGIRKLISKPINVRYLAEAVREVLDETVSSEQ